MTSRFETLCIPQNSPTAPVARSHNCYANSLVNYSNCSTLT